MRRRTQRYTRIDTLFPYTTFFRSRHDQGHAEKLLTLCGRWVNQVPECYVDLVRTERAANNPGRLQALVTAASDKYDDGLVEAHTPVGIARVLVAPLDVGADDDADSYVPLAHARFAAVGEDEGALTATAGQA